MSGGVLNIRFWTRLLTSGDEDFERMSALKEDISTTTGGCELTMFILSISVTFSVTSLTVTSLIRAYEIMPATLANTFLFILQDSAVADLRYGGRF